MTTNLLLRLDFENYWIGLMIQAKCQSKCYILSRKLWTGQWVIPTIYMHPKWIFSSCFVLLIFLLLKKKKFKDFISIYYLYSKERYRESGGKPLRVYLMDDNPKILISCHTLIFYITPSAYLKSYTLWLL